MASKFYFILFYLIFNIFYSLSACSLIISAHFLFFAFFKKWEGRCDRMVVEFTSTLATSANIKTKQKTKQNNPQETPGTIRHRQVVCKNKIYQDIMTQKVTSQSFRQNSWNTYPGFWITLLPRKIKWPPP